VVTADYLFIGSLLWKTIWEVFCFSHLGIGIESDATGTGIPASGFSVRYRSILVPDGVPLFRYRNGSGVGIFNLFLPGLTVRHFGI
jgi:hypothetical protein